MGNRVRWDGKRREAPGRPEGAIHKPKGGERACQEGSKASRVANLECGTALLCRFRFSPALGQRRNKSGTAKQCRTPNWPSAPRRSAARAVVVVLIPRRGSPARAVVVIIRTAADPVVG